MKAIALVAVREAAAALLLVTIAGFLTLLFVMICERLDSRIHALTPERLTITVPARLSVPTPLVDLEGDLATPCLYAEKHQPKEVSAK